MGFILFLIIAYVLLSVSLYKVFEKAELPGWHGFVPGLNFMTMCELVGRKPRHALWLLFPIVNIFIFVGLCIDVVRSFGHHKFWHSFVAAVTPAIAFFVLGYRPEEQYEGPILLQEQAYNDKIQAAVDKGSKTMVKKLRAQNPYKKSGGREWVESIIFAVFAAAFIRMFLIEMYKIPTSSMEGSLLVGDFLCVSKVHYGMRTPMTIAMIPLLHNRIPFINKESYWEKPSLPYFRLPKLQTIKRNNPVVFNYPEGDSVFITPARTFGVYDLHRQNQPVGNREIITRPMDKMDHYIKRCLAIPGDSLQIIDRQVYINGEPGVNPSNMQFAYYVQSQGTPLNRRALEEWGVNLSDSRDPVYMLNAEQVAKIEGMGNTTVTPYEHTSRPLYPYDPKINDGWTVDNYGPIYIPKEGVTTPLNMDNIAFYKRVIQSYEHNDLEIRGNDILINGEVATSYTFKMDYYWMMGDNRHNSEDSRVWGYVPADHVVGKPLFIWFSTSDGETKSGIRWNRIFTSAQKP